MPLLLCHDCLNWGEPLAQRCPVCQAELDLLHRDLPRHVLERRLGDPLASLASVRVQRSHLGDIGELQLTTTGLCFLPHTRWASEHVLEVLRSNSPSSLIEKVTRWPAWWWGRGREEETERPAPEVWSPTPLSRRGDRDFVDVFLESPGALHVQIDSIVRLEFSQRSIEIDRRFMTPLRLIRLSDAEAWQSSLSLWRETPGWEPLFATSVSSSQ